MGLAFAGVIEVEVAKHSASKVTGYMAALCFRAAHSISALILNLGFVRLCHVDRENLDASLEPESVDVV